MRRLVRREMREGKKRYEARVVDDDLPGFRVPCAELRKTPQGRE